VRCALVVNPQAGGGRGAQRGVRAAEDLRAAGVRDLVIVRPGSAADTVEQVRRLCNEGIDVVIACGGDGTVHQVLQGIMGDSGQARAILGIIPAGSGDDIARALGCTGDRLVQRLAEAIADARIRESDVSMIEHASGIRWSLGVISCGFDSAVNERANAMERIKGKARYLVGILAELRSFSPVPYRAVLDERIVQEPAILVAIGNGHCYGGGMRICPDARCDDGVLDVTWVGRVSRRTLLRLFPRIYSGAHMSHVAVSGYRARCVHIEAEGQLAYADGERVGTLPITVTVQPGALRVLSP